MIHDVDYIEWFSLSASVVAVSIYGYVLTAWWPDPLIDAAGGIALLSVVVIGAVSADEMTDNGDLPWYSFGFGVIGAATTVVALAAIVLFGAAAMLVPPIVAYLAAFVGTTIGAGLVYGLMLNGLRLEVLL